jgi:enterochelin esterase-like enzyme
MRLLAAFLLLLLPLAHAVSAGAADFAKDSLPQEGVPQGKVTTHPWRSTIYEGTVRNYSVYVPAQYDARRPAALMVFQDGHAYLKPDGSFRTTTVFDNLIHRREMPVTIALFVDPGHQGESPPADPFKSSNRSREYDELSDTYAQFLLKELIPELRKHWNISDDPRMHAIAGLSSGGICAFTAAWQRPDYFHKVLSHIGSYVNINGGHTYPALIRMSESKPIRVLLQDGSNDLDNRFGNWWLANQQMAATLKFRGYDYTFVRDEGVHSGAEGGRALPESLRWLWRDWNTPNPGATKIP